jgi:serine protease Do
MSPPRPAKAAQACGVTWGCHQVDAIKVAAAINDVAQNVNFAIKTTVLTNFLDASGVSYMTAGIGQSLQPSDLAERGKSISVLIRCEK